MKRTGLSLLTGLFLLMTSLTAQAKSLSVDGGYVYLPIAGSNATAGYGSLKNSSKKALKVAIVRAKGFKAVELHETVQEGEMMKMRKVESFEIAAGGSFELKPGGNHIMLFDAEKEFKEGDKLEVIFKIGETETPLSFAMKPRTAKKKEDSHAGH